MNKLKYWLNRFMIRFNKDYKECDGECEECGVQKQCKEIDDYITNKK